LRRVCRATSEISRPALLVLTTSEMRRKKSGRLKSQLQAFLIPRK
jgi:hypothetical protein